MSVSIPTQAHGDSANARSSTEGSGRAGYLTLAESAKYLHLSERTVRRHIEAGMIPARRLGRNIRLRREDLDAAMAPIDGSATTSESLESFIESMTSAQVKP